MATVYSTIPKSEFLKNILNLSSIIKYYYYYHFKPFMHIFSLISMTKWALHRRPIRDKFEYFWISSTSILHFLASKSRLLSIYDQYIFSIHPKWREIRAWTSNMSFINVCVVLIYSIRNILNRKSGIRNKIPATLINGINE